MRGLIDESTVADVAAVDGVAPPSPKSAAPPSCSVPTASPLAAMDPPPSPPTGSLIPSSAGSLHRRPCARRQSARSWSTGPPPSEAGAVDRR